MKPCSTRLFQAQVASRVLHELLKYSAGKTAEERLESSLKLKGTCTTSTLVKHAQDRRSCL